METPTNDEQARQYLLEFLQDEFRQYPEARIRLLPLSRHDGVSVKTEAREYFFPTVWMKRLAFAEINAEIGKIKIALKA